MNILPKKRWHVRNQDNKERVRRDEENARLEQKKEEDRIALAEQEARISLLRRKNNVDSSLKEDRSSEGHVNLFAREEESGVNYRKENADYMTEKKAEKESFEKKIGLLTYVGQSSVDDKGEGKLWYAEPKERKTKENSDSEVDEAKKSRLDPLAIIEKNLSRKKSKKERKKNKKNKYLEKSDSQSSKSIEKLREERLLREKMERERTNRFLKVANNPGESEESKVQGNASRYSNQFHPGLARRKHEHPYPH